MIFAIFCDLNFSVPQNGGIIMQTVAHSIPQLVKSALLYILTIIFRSWGDPHFMGILPKRICSRLSPVLSVDFSKNCMEAVHFLSSVRNVFSLISHRRVKRFCICFLFELSFRRAWIPLNVVCFCQPFLRNWPGLILTYSCPVRFYWWNVTNCSLWLQQLECWTPFTIEILPYFCMGFLGVNFHSANDPRTPWFYSYNEVTHLAEWEIIEFGPPDWSHRHSMCSWFLS